MRHQLNLLIATGFLCLVGCGTDSNSFRTYSESTDGDSRPETEQVAAQDNSSDVADTALASAAGEPEAGTRDDSASSPAYASANESTYSETSVVSIDSARPPRVPQPERIANLSSDGQTIGEQNTGGETGPREIKLLIPDREFNRVDPDNALRVSYDDLDLLKILNMDPVTPDVQQHLPSWLKGLDGQLVRLRGFMYPPYRETGLTGFLFARDNQICCFQRQPKEYDVFPVFLKDDVTTDYIANRPFDVVGRFRISIDVYDGKVEQLYEIEDAIVIKP